MSCKRYKRQIPDYIDGTLSDREKQELEAHLEVCPRCREEMDRMRRYTDFSSSYVQKKAPGSMRDEIWKNISAVSAPKTTKGKQIRILPGLIITVTAAAAIALILLIPSLTGPNEITISFDYTIQKKGKGPAGEQAGSSDTDGRLSDILDMAKIVDYSIEEEYINPAGLTDGISLKLARKDYDLFRQEFNSYSTYDKLPEIFFRSDRGSVRIQVYFSGRKFFTGDFNSDGLVDMGVYFNRGRYRGEFFIAYNNGDNGYMKPERLTAGDIPGYLSRSDNILGGDFNNDGFDDLLISFSDGTDAGRRIIYLNNGQKGFKEGIPCEHGEGWFSGDGLANTLAGDFNGDGYCDIVMHYFSGKHAGRFMVSYNTGMSFSEPEEFTTGFNSLPSELKYTPRLMDINRDGYSDLILYWQEGERNASWYVSENNGSGSGAMEYKAGFNNGTMAFQGDYLPFTGDINGDGFDELLVKSGTMDEVANWYLMMNDRDGSFTSADHFIDFGGETDLIVR